MNYLLDSKNVNHHKLRYLHFKNTFYPLLERGNYKVFVRMHESFYGIIHRNEHANIISAEGEVWLLKLYDDVGSFFFIDILFTNGVGDEDMAEKMYALIRYDAVRSCEIRQGAVVTLNTPYAMIAPKKSPSDREKALKRYHRPKKKKHA